MELHLNVPKKFLFSPSMIALPKMCDSFNQFFKGINFNFTPRNSSTGPDFDLNSW